MSSKKLSITEVQAHAGTIVNGLLGLKTSDGVRVLCTALNLVVERSETEFPGFIEPGNVNFLPRKSGRMLKVDSDLALKDFILSFDEFISIKTMHQKLVERFGDKRAPSENTLRNYFKRKHEANS